VTASSSCGSGSDVSNLYRVRLEELTDKTVKRCKPASQQGCGELLPLDRYVKRKKTNTAGEVYYVLENWCKSCQRKKDAAKSRLFRERQRSGRFRMAFDSKKKGWRIYADNEHVRMARHEREAKEIIRDLEAGVRLFDTFFRLPAPPLKWCREAQDLVAR